MKQLTQAVFDLPECPEWAKSAAVDSDGDAYCYNTTKEELEKYRGDEWWNYRQIEGTYCDYIGTGYDTTDWQNSAINRE